MTLWRTGTFPNRRSPLTPVLLVPQVDFSMIHQDAISSGLVPTSHNITWLALLFILLNVYSDAFSRTGNMQSTPPNCPLSPLRKTANNLSRTKPDRLPFCSVSLSASNTMDYLTVSPVSLPLRGNNHLPDILNLQSLLHYFPFINFKAKWKGSNANFRNYLFILSWTTWGQACTFGRKTEVSDILVYKVSHQVSKFLCPVHRLKTQESQSS